METRELTDMTAVLRSINDGNPSNAERWAALQKKPKREPKPQPLNQGGGFRKTGHSLPII